MRLLILGSVLVLPLSATAGVQSFILAEKEAVRLPDGRRVVLLDDSKKGPCGRGVELFIDGVGRVRVAEGMQIAIPGTQFGVICELADLDDDRARIGIVTPDSPPQPKPVRTRRPAGQPAAPANAVTRAPPRVPARPLQPPTAIQPTTPSAAPPPSPAPTRQPSAVEVENQNRARALVSEAEAALNNATPDPDQFEELIGAEADVGAKDRRRYHLVVALYAHRLTLLGAKDAGRIAESAMRKAKAESGLPDPPFSVCPKVWTVDTRTLWERTKPDGVAGTAP